MIDETVELSGEVLPCEGERTARGEVAGQLGVENGEAGPEDAAVGLGEQDGDRAAGGCELIAVAALDPVDDLFARSRRRS